jgi:hypothetical protein
MRRSQAFSNRGCRMVDGAPTSDERGEALVDQHLYVEQVENLVCWYTVSTGQTDRIKYINQRPVDHECLKEQPYDSRTFPKDQHCTVNERCPTRAMDNCQECDLGDVGEEEKEE